MVGLGQRDGVGVWLAIGAALVLVGLGLVLVALSLREAPDAAAAGGVAAPTGQATGGATPSATSELSRYELLLTQYPLPGPPSAPTWPPARYEPESSASPSSAQIGPFSGGTEYGIQIHGCGPYDLQNALDLAAEGGFTWVKQQVRWEEFESAMGQYSWDCLDRVISGANERGLKVLLSVTTTPVWARAAEDELHPSHPGLLADFCRQMVLRYRGQVHALEVWNEPNLRMEWGDYMDPNGYKQLLDWTYWFVKDSAPEVAVISAGLAPTEWSAWDVAVPDDVFLTDLVGMGGLESADCIGVHFNHGTESPLVPGGQFERLVNGYREISGGDVPLCVTETGYAVPRGGRLPKGFEWAATNTAEAQAQWLADEWRWAEAHPGVLGLVIVFNLDYWSDDSKDVNALYALWSPGGMMPAFEALREVNGWVIGQR